MQAKSDIVTFKKINRMGCLTGVSTRKFGSIKSKGEILQSNLNRFLKTYRLDPVKAVFMNQVHGKKVVYVSNNKKIVLKTDGIFTNKKNLILCVVTADCMPLIFYSPTKKITGVVHAGYKGLLEGIIQEMLLKFKSHHIEAEDICVGIGPCIGDCCYDVPKERVNAFTGKYSYPNIYQDKGGKYFLDLKKIGLSILLENGVKKKNIEVLPFCTRCNVSNFYSYRADNKQTFGEFVTFIAVK